MLYWNANFQIPNSGVQCKDVYVVVEENLIKYYSEKELLNNFLTEEHNFPSNVDRYDYLLTLEKFSQYERVH